MKEFTRNIDDIKKETEVVLGALNEGLLLQYLNVSDFYTAPASTIFHGNHTHGLAIHSYLVAKTAQEIAKSLELTSPVPGVSTENFAYILGIVHDLCKVNFYEEYQKNIKDENGKWVSVPAFKVKDEHSSYGHGLTSYMRLSKLIKNEDLVKALTYPVIYHMGGYDVSESAEKGYQKAQNDFPWLTVLQSADLLAAFVLGS